MRLGRGEAEFLVGEIEAAVVVRGLGGRGFGFGGDGGRGNGVEEALGRLRFGRGLSRVFLLAEVEVVGEVEVGEWVILLAGRTAGGLRGGAGRSGI